MEYFAMFLGVFGLYLVGEKNRWGFMVWIVSNSLWIIFATIHGHWGMLTQFIIFSGVAIWNWYKWKPEPIETNYG